MAEFGINKTAKIGISKLAVYKQCTFSITKIAELGIAKIFTVPDNKVGTTRDRQDDSVCMGLPRLQRWQRSGLQYVRFRDYKVGTTRHYQEPGITNIFGLFAVS